MKTSPFVLAAVLAAALSPMHHALAQDHASHPKPDAQHTKVSKEAATRIALAKVPGGKIQSTELEHEKGAMVWSFDISMPGHRDITEILVNAETGQIVDISTETPSQQEKEAEEDEHGQH